MHARTHGCEVKSASTSRDENRQYCQGQGWGRQKRRILHIASIKRPVKDVMDCR
jgi:hypothetical protein